MTVKYKYAQFTIPNLTVNYHNQYSIDTTRGDPVEINFDKKRLQDPIIEELVNILDNNSAKYFLDDAQLYFDFPVLKDAEDTIVIAQLLLISLRHGLITIAFSNTTEHNTYFYKDLASTEDKLENIFSLLYSRLIRNKNLRRSKTDLSFPTNAFIFAPLLDESVKELDFDTPVLTKEIDILRYLEEARTDSISVDVYKELLSTLDGAKGLVRPKSRDVPEDSRTSKGALANRIESEISTFDKQQKQGAIAVLDGFQRIRGLAGSANTVVLAMKAALTHLRNPEANIIYTFYTKTLYQHIQRLITRFYRQFDDKDPDWEKLKIMHGWGGFTSEGVYSYSCKAFNVKPITYREVDKTRHDPFDFACKNLMQNAEILPIVDYIFVDEGQDFPASFIELCLKLAKNNRVVYAYDDLQTIFQVATPSIKEIVGVDNQGNPLVDLNEDVVLDKCYRNPREILVCAHALGFGIYGRIVQMLENREQWEDIGYQVVQGEFVPGSYTKIERPARNSLTTISENQKPEEIVQVFVFSDFEDEINYVCESIRRDLQEGLRPDDILVVTVDDRFARSYLGRISVGLDALGISSNNIHVDSYGIKDFQKEGKVTLSTVHKAKGNESFMVYVIGVDALYTSYASVRERNVLFTAMTRAKGWVRVSGIGQGAMDCDTEIRKALSEFPYLCFEYPSEEQLKIIKRDLAEKAVRKKRAERKIDEALEDMSLEDIKRYLERRNIKKGK